MNQNESKRINSDSNSLSDAELVRMAKNDKVHFALIYNKHWESVYRFVFKRLGRETDVHDITQDVFVKAFSNIHKYEDRGYAFTSWLFRIAISEISNAARKWKLELAFHANSHEIESLLLDVYDEQIDIKEENLARALENLREPEMQMIQMRYFEKRKLKQVAEILEISESNCKVKMFRIIKKLKSSLLK